jgi:N4-(beta-N-acetylglucosaminyl)-L-asparaginase
MFNRRKFLHTSALSSLGLILNKVYSAAAPYPGIKNSPIVISTWAPNTAANAEAWKILGAGGRAVDAVEAGVQVPEANPTDQSVGYGGLPDRDGNVTLDACIMDEKGNCGSVMFVEGIMHPIKLARLVMDKTPHVQLVGEGALQFAIANGFKIENLLTPESEKAWKQWTKNAQYDPMTIPRLLEQKSTKDGAGQEHNHDTIGMIAMDAAGDLSGGCSTSGMAFKMRGRVGDSPVIGAGLYVDNTVGAATATGVGEEVVRICGAHTVVELMRQGLSAEAACKKALERLISMRGQKAKDFQVAFIAVKKSGGFGGYAMQEGFTYAVQTRGGSKVYKAKSLAGG